jgi:asparagine synthase (glutamine-hydrolysing)
MCGIAGILALSGDAPELPQLCRMAAALAHRGPDEFGVYRDGHAGLAHARLSIIDLTTGQQPLSNEDGSLWVVFNGEIFNYIELRRELQAAGHRFRTQSDTEVIVHAHEEWGDDAFRRFNGQFAIALWDTRARRLTFARDRAGIRPLYVAREGNRLWFGSEVKAIFAGAPALRRELDPIGLDEVFTFWSPVAPQTVFAGVSELRPGHVRVVDADGDHERPFVTAAFAGGSLPTFPGSIEEASEAVRAALERATALRMLRSDVPVGSYLSGGLDSSLVAALGLCAKGSGFQTFSITFADREFDESEFQTEMVARLGGTHTSVHVHETDVAEHFPAVVEHAEKPLLRTAPVPMYLLSGLVRRSGIKVVLTGEGADEVFAGYDLFREAKVRRFWARHPDSTLRPRLLERLYPYLARSPVAQRAFARGFFGQDLANSAQPGFSHGPRFRATAALKRLFSPEVRAATAGFDATARLLGALPAEQAAWSPLARDQYLEMLTLLPGYILSSQGDRMLMAHSVEGRFPFLDVDVMTLANSLPDAYKLRVLDEKHVLKRMARDLVPAGILRRKKQPYRAPDAACFVGASAPDWVAELTDARALRQVGIFDPGAVEKLFAKCRTGAVGGQFSNTDNMAVTGVLSTQLLATRLLDAPPASGTISLTTLVDPLHERPEP